MHTPTSWVPYDSMGPADDSVDTPGLSPLIGIASKVDTVRGAIDLLIYERRKDKAFRDRLRRMIKDDRPILDRLAR